MLQVSKEYEDYGGLVEDPKSMSLGEFMSWYFSGGFGCLFEVDNDDPRCNYSFLYLLGYVISLFMLQITLTYVSQFINDVNTCS